MVGYWYDAWGNIVATTNVSDSYKELANLNPFRYRGYYYDTETGLYYLKTRYYDPEIGRFINMDSMDFADPETINGLNLYAYCNNNPVMNVDPDGTSWWNSLIKVVAWVAVGVTLAVSVVATGGAAVVATVALGAAVGGLVGGYMNENQGGAFISGWVGGAVNGTIQTAGNLLFGYDGTIIGGGIGATAGSLITQKIDSVISGQEFNFANSMNNAIKAGMGSAFMSVFTAGIQFMGKSGTGETIGGSIIDNLNGSVFGEGSNIIFTTFFSAIDDMISYLIKI